MDKLRIEDKDGGTMTTRSWDSIVEALVKAGELRPMEGESVVANSADRDGVKFRFKRP